MTDVSSVRPTMVDRDAGPMEVSLLEGFQVRCGSTEALLPMNAQRLVAHLGLAVRPHRSLVAGTLWPNVTDRHAQGSLRSTLWRLDQSCPGLVLSVQGGVGLAPEVRVDARELAGWARRMLDPAEGLAANPTPDVVFRGELLPGWYDEWVLVERERLHQLRLHALEALAHKLAQEGRFGEALEAAHGAVRCEPLRESAHRVTVRIHLAEGNVAEALAQYERFAQLLQAQLGLEPSDRMTGLIAAFRPARRARGWTPAAHRQAPHPRDREPRGAAPVPAARRSMPTGSMPTAGVPAPWGRDSVDAATP
jgi:DNA-binding SARP family transcriptional activator